MGMLSEILIAEKPISVFVPTLTADSYVQTKQPTVADRPESPPEPDRSWPNSILPPPISCLICNCPAIWSSTLDRETFQCCDCDPPPVTTPPGRKPQDPWDWRGGGWQWVARRLWLVLWEDGQFHWESLPRADYSRSEY